MLVKYYMSSSPMTIAPHQTIAEALDILNTYRFRHLPVVDENGCLLGMLTDRDLRSATPSSVAQSPNRNNVEETVRNTPVSVLMDKDCQILYPFSTLDRALLLFQSENIGALAVVDDDRKVIGIFSALDLMKAYRFLFGLGEKGSSLISIEDNGDPQALRKLVHVMEENNIIFTRLIRSSAGGSEKRPMIYLRINTYNIRAVHQAIEAAGFSIHVPDIS